jgi:hypothetical protein
MAITSCSNVERAWVSVRKWVGAGAQSVHTYVSLWQILLQKPAIKEQGKG